MKKYSEILKACALFNMIKEEDLLKMLNCLGAKVATFDKKYTIINEGSQAKYVGIMLSGSAQVSMVDYYGNRSIISRIEQAEMFGEAFACAEISSVPVTITANEPSEVMLIDCSHILHTCKNNCGFHQQLIYNLMKDLAIKTLTFHQKLEIVSKRTTQDKLLTYLSFQAKKAHSPSFEIPFDRQELADYLEVERTGLSVEISKLKNEGVLFADKKHFELL